MELGLSLAWFGIAALSLGILARLNLSRSLAPLPLRALGFGLAIGGIVLALAGGALAAWLGFASGPGTAVTVSAAALAFLALVTGVRAWLGSRATRL